jgi:hypothetical protein
MAGHFMRRLPENSESFHHLEGPLVKQAVYFPSQQTSMHSEMRNNKPNDKVNLGRKHARYAHSAYRAPPFGPGAPSVNREFLMLAPVQEQKDSSRLPGQPGRPSCLRRRACCMAANISTTVEANASCENGPLGCDTTGVHRTMAELE